MLKRAALVTTESVMYFNSCKIHYKLNYNHIVYIRITLLFDSRKKLTKHMYRRSFHKFSIDLIA